jgi:hypothetical protein
LFGKRKIKIFKECGNLVDELETYSWEDSDDDVENSKDKVRKKKDHLVDALRYAITSSSYMLPESRAPEYTTRVDIQSDPTTGYPIGVTETSDLISEFIGKGHLTIIRK